MSDSYLDLDDELLFGEDYDDDDLDEDVPDDAELPRYPVIRLLIAPAHRAASTDRIEATLTSIFPDMAPEHVEDFFRSAGTAFRNVGRVIADRGPAILSSAARGATAGAAGGPGGILGGAVLGGASGAWSASPASPPPSGSAAVSGGSAGNAVPQLLALLAQPQTFLALLAAALGRAGRPTVPAGSTAVPVASILSALGTIATRAAEELSVEEALAEGVPEYLSSAEVEHAIDPANSDARADHVLTILVEANEAERDDDDDEDEYDEYVGDEDDDYQEDDWP
jgi:hypothetical protein